MPVGIVSCELHLPSCRSLKDKRRVIKSLIERLHQRCRVSIAETGFHDLHQRSEITMALVTSSAGEMEKRMEEMRSLVESDVELFLTRWDDQLLEEG